MSMLFLKILSMSLTASVVICVVLLLRLVLRRAPKVFSYVLWLAAAFRLLCPLSYELPVGIPSANVSIAEESVLLKSLAVPAQSEAVNNDLNDLIVEYDPAVSIPEMHGYSNFPDNTGAADDNDSIPSASDPDYGYTQPIAVETAPPYIYDEGYFRNDEAAETSGSSAAQTENETSFTLLFLISLIWLAGSVIMAMWGIISYIRLSLRLKDAEPYRENVCITNKIGNAFIMGIFRPRIYLPQSCNSTDRELILLHERTHLRRGDHIAKPVMYAALCLHWFNPLVWVSFRLFEKDMEMSCDEKVTGSMSREEKADYSQALLSVSAKKAAAFTACFGESGAKSRIKNVLSFKKPALWVMLLSGAAVVFMAAFLMGNSSPDIFDEAHVDFSDGAKIHEIGSFTATYSADELSDLEKMLHKARITSDSVRITDPERSVRISVGTRAMEISRGYENDKEKCQISCYDLAIISKGFAEYDIYKISGKDCEKIFAEIDKLPRPDETNGYTVFSSLFGEGRDEYYDSYTFYDNVFAAPGETLNTGKGELPGGAVGEFLTALKDISATPADGSSRADSELREGAYALMTECVNFNRYTEKSVEGEGVQIYIYSGDGRYYIQVKYITVTKSLFESSFHFIGEEYFYEISEDEYNDLVDLGMSANEEAKESLSGLDMILRHDFKVMDIEYDGETTKHDSAQTAEFLELLSEKRYSPAGYAISSYIDGDTLDRRVISLYPDDSRAEYNNTVLFLCSAKTKEGSQVYYIDIATANSIQEYKIPEDTYIQAINCLSYYRIGAPEIISLFNYRRHTTSADSVFIDENHHINIEYANDEICIITAPSAEQPTEQNPYPRRVCIYSFSEKEILFDIDTACFTYGADRFDSGYHTDISVIQAECTSRGQPYYNGTMLYILLCNFTGEDELNNYENKPADFIPTAYCYVAEVDDISPAFDLKFRYVPDPHFVIGGLWTDHAENYGVDSVSRSAAIIREGEYAYLDLYNYVPALKSIEIVKHTADGDKRFRLFDNDRIALMNTIINKYDYSSAVIEVDGRTAMLSGEECIEFFKELPYVNGDRLVSDPIAQRIDPDSLESCTLTLYPAHGGEPDVLSLDYAKLSDGGNVWYYTIEVSGVKAEYILAKGDYDLAKQRLDSIK